MIQTLPRGRVVLTSDEAAAYAVMLARVRAIGCYPITPQTVIVERLADPSRGETTSSTRCSRASTPCSGT